ncbi:MAG: hypothetical protein JWP29_1975 [Rhodoferax sp.]|nr:hypothetical protein [Rhodoferax sp.]
MRSVVLIGLLLAGCNSATPAPECSASAPSVMLNEPTLEPAVWDNGQSTYFRFPGNARIPSIFVVNPDGKEAVANYTVDPEAGTIAIHQTARMFKLRDGDKVACIANLNWNPVGWNPGTGTTSTDVVREPKSARP